MFHELQSSLGPWMDPVVAGSWASILALMTSLYGLVWVRRTRLLLKKDRERNSMSLPEIHYSLQRVERYVRKQAADPEQISLLRCVHRAEYALERHLEKIFEENPGRNAFVRVAKFYHNIGEVNLAVANYRKAIICLEQAGYLKSSEGPKNAELSGTAGHSLAAKHDLVRKERPRHDPVLDEAAECFYELQSCHLAVWQIKAAARVARHAEASGRMDGYIRETKIKSRWIYLRCAEHTLVFLARDFMAKITRKKGRV